MNRLAHTRRTLLSGGIGALAAGRVAVAADDPIEFDARAVRRILSWIESGAAGDPPEWRAELPYRLAREQAQWSGRPSPDLEVERSLRSVKAGALHDTAAFVEQILAGRQRFLSAALPHLHAYLPPATSIRGTVALAAFLPNFAFSMNYTIVASVTDRFWGNSTDRLFNLLGHELFHNGFIQHQPGSSPNDARDGAALVQALLWQVQNEGLATYVAYRARPAGLTLNDYRLLDDAAEVARRFELLRNLTRDLRAAREADLPALRERFWQESNTQRVPYIAGAAMARRIEEQAGRPKLIHTIEAGPQAFVDAYIASSPPSDLRP